REVQALRAHLAFVALGFRFGAARGGGRLGVRLGERDLRFELLGRRELALGLGLERSGAGDFGACAGGGEGRDLRPPSPSLPRTGGGNARGTGASFTAFVGCLTAAATAFTPATARHHHELVGS